MNTIRWLLHVTAGPLLALASCSANAPVDQADASDLASSKARVTNKAMDTKMTITIGVATFTATLEDNPAVAKLKSLLPLTLNMTELNGNEKYHDLKVRLPTDAISPGTIESGDLMLYGDNTLVLFYEKFETTYSYTRLGRIENRSGLAAAIGTEDVTITFSLEK